MRFSIISSGQDSTYQVDQQGRAFRTISSGQEVLVSLSEGKPHKFYPYRYCCREQDIQEDLSMSGWIRATLDG